MYLRFFGLTNHPFKTPAEREALFVGRPQEETLAHLRYALEEGEGVTVITGERGVGKTTVCRAFLDRLDPSIAVAFLSAPVRSPGELLRRTNAAFGIPADASTLKGLIDPLNEFLMRRKMAGGKAVFVIDDAQTLATGVLEQIRLISNLETTREKLIHLVLIGEPGLLDALNSHALRQMGQRVSVRCELEPLSEEETSAYIRHRLSKASTGSPVLFDPGALRAVYRYARGNPRRIGAACAAALAAAFSAGQKAVAEETARAAVNELARVEGGDGTRPRRRVLLAAGAGCLLAAAAAGFYFWRPEAGVPPPQTAGVAAGAAAVGVAQKSVPPPLPSVAASTPEASESPPDGSSTPAPAPPEAAGSVSGTSAPPTHSVQVGAFLLAENAVRLVDRLAAGGYKARVFEAVDSAGRRWHTVRIGDYPSSAEARSRAEAFTRAEGMQSIVRPYGRF